MSSHVSAASSSAPSLDTVSKHPAVQNLARRVALLQRQLQQTQQQLKRAFSFSRDLTLNSLNQHSDLETALDRLNILLQINPTHLETHLDRAKLCLWLGRDGDSEEYLNLAQKSISAIIADHFEHPDALAIQGEIHRRSGDVDKAFFFLTRAIDFNANHSFALARRGDLYRAKGEYSSALEDLDQALALEPRSVFSLSVRAEVLRQKGQLKLALADLNRILAILPESVFALSLRADIYRQQGQFDKALIDAYQAQDLNSTPEIAELIDRILKHQSA